MLLLAALFLGLEGACSWAQISCPDGRVPWPKDNSTPYCQDFSEASEEATAFLVNNMPPWDVLEYGKISGGILGPTVKLALKARQRHAWAALVPEDIWRDWVLPYASVDESRNDWREFMVGNLAPLVANATSLSQAALILNQHLWSVLRPKGSVVFKGGSTPMVYDPMSTLVFGYASCTGVSILYVDSLRALGIPARLVGTPAWHGKLSDGNHNWVEIWVGSETKYGEGGRNTEDGHWTFIEGAPAGGGETLTNPCDKWFCNPAHMDGKTKVFAARFDRHMNTSIYPLAWDLNNSDIPGVDRTSYYVTACGHCQSNAAGKIAGDSTVKATLARDIHAKLPVENGLMFYT